MPTHNNAFGNTNVTLRFKERHAWAYRQPVQFRFNRTGTKAAAAALAAGTISSAHAAAGNPNWYVYWQQVASQFSHDVSRTFGPQARMVYNAANTSPEDWWGSYTIETHTGPTYQVPSQDEWITLYDILSRDIVDCIRILHHENGHRQSYQLPNSKGGWGGNLTYYWRNDVDVEDIITEEGMAVAVDRWEEWNDQIHVEFEKSHDDFEPNCNDSALLVGRHHGAYNQEDGTGFCTRNERHVVEKALEIRKKDWSLK